MPFLSRLTLNQFRNYESNSFTVPNTPIIITGPNGSGKTSILEAISLLSPGRGLRNATLPELLHQTNTADSKPETNQTPWSVTAHITKGDDEYIVGTGGDPNNFKLSKRIVRINGESKRSHHTLTEIANILWVTPLMDRLFLDGPSVRRKFVDRLAYAFDTEHAKRVALYEHNMRERLKLLRTGKHDPAWLDILEAQMAEQGVKTAIARQETLARIREYLPKLPTHFPKPTLSMSGEIDLHLTQQDASSSQSFFQQKLKETRSKDGIQERTNIGVHKSDLVAHYADKSLDAHLGSTGEQKALLLSILIAHAHAMQNTPNKTPILLLDEVVAHLDAHRRNELFEAIEHLSIQAWMTGTDLSAFDAMRANAHHIPLGNL